jgi:NADPH-dependent glutamate synthase beta subunit-like oxidoreductase
MENFNHCLMRNPPFCRAQCPFHVDVTDFIDKAAKGTWQSAYRIYRDAVGFPRIVARICPQPCKAVCPLREEEGAIEMNRLEQAALALTGSTTPNNYNIPRRNKRIAIIGGGISGLGCALRLASKKYMVVLFEQSHRIGGVLNDTLDSRIIQADLDEQFQFEEYHLHLNHRVHDRRSINAMGFDAVYVATGRGGADFGLLENESHCLVDETVGYEGTADETPNVLSDRAGLGAAHGAGKTAWFAGGGLIGNAGIYGLADGLLMGTVMEAWLKTGNLLYPKNDYETHVRLHPLTLTMRKMHLAAEAEKPLQPLPELPDIKENETAIQAEAGRCLRCQCDACRRFCDLTAYYNKWPPRIRDEVFATTLPGTAEVKTTPAKRLMSTCNQCGICREVCPEDIDMGSLILAGRQSMHRQEKAPWAFHDFWLRDMEFSDGDSARLCKAGRGQKSGLAFFPGCQLGASDPKLILRSYHALRQQDEDMGILLRCCGAPAEWSGNVARHQTALTSILQDWQDMGKPTLLTACPTCTKKFAAYLPQIPIRSVYEQFCEWRGIGGNSEQASQKAVSVEAMVAVPTDAPSTGRDWAVFDPCSARHDAPVRQAVRDLAQAAGFSLSPLPLQDEIPRCCGYGGQPAIANPGYADFVAERRVRESALPYITYCINCRDIFTKQGKESRHILEILFPAAGACEQDDPGEKARPTVTERRENRAWLKRALINRYWEETMVEKKEAAPFRLTIHEGLKEKMDKERILEEEVVQVIDFAERSGRKVRHTESGIFSACRQIGHMTYWADYRQGERAGEWVLVNVYCHRMAIDMEPVWQGLKTEQNP